MKSVETVKVSSKGQIVIPKAMRDSHRIKTGDLLVVSSSDGELHLRRAAPVRATSLDSVAGMLHRPGRKKLSDTELDRKLADQFLADDQVTKTE
jgi:AbrB family looped-hinge helix DNA binding protein